MIGRMKFNFVDALAEAVEDLQLRDIAVGLDRPSCDFSRTGSRTKCRKPLSMRPTTCMRQHLAQDNIGVEKTDVFERRRLVRDLVGFETVLRTEGAHRRAPEQSHAGPAWPRFSFRTMLKDYLGPSSCRSTCTTTSR